MGRVHSERLLHNLQDVRRELTETVSPIPDDELGWAPAEDMKSYRALLQEIGCMERICTRWLATGDFLEWDMPGHVPANSTQSALQDLSTIRAETKAYLETVDESTLQTAVPVPAEWQQYWGNEIEPEEVIRWIAQHEYYHLGQIITYRWSQGHNPYQVGDGATV